MESQSPRGNYNRMAKPWEVITMESQSPRIYNRITEPWEIITMESQSPGRVSQWNNRTLGLITTESQSPRGNYNRITEP